MNDHLQQLSHYIPHRRGMSIKISVRKDPSTFENYDQACALARAYHGSDAIVHFTEEQFNQTLQEGFTFFFHCEIKVLEMLQEDVRCPGERECLVAKEQGRRWHSGHCQVIRNKAVMTIGSSYEQALARMVDYAHDHGYLRHPD